MIDQQGPPKMKIKLHKIDQRWLDERCYSEPADLEPELIQLADDAGRLADCEDKLIETIRDNKRNLERLPEIIQGLERQLNSVSLDLAETLERHDQLAEARQFLRAKQRTGSAPVPGPGTGATVQQPAEVENNPLTEYAVSCPECDNMNCNPTTPPDEGLCEYWCNNCGHYFFDDAPPGDDREVESGPQFPFPYRCNDNKCDGVFMGGPGVLRGDICPICNVGYVVNAEERTGV